MRERNFFNNGDDRDRRGGFSRDRQAQPQQYGQSFNDRYQAQPPQYGQYGQPAYGQQQGYGQQPQYGGGTYPQSAGAYFPGAGNVTIKYPRTYQDVQNLIDRLKMREQIIVDFSALNQQSTFRILDFLSGAIYALGGSVQQLRNNMFLFVPSGVTIQTSSNGNGAK